MSVRRRRTPLHYLRRWWTWPSIVAEKQQAEFRAIMLKKRTCSHCGRTGPLSREIVRLLWGLPGLGRRARRLVAILQQRASARTGPRGTGRVPVRALNPSLHRRIQTAQPSPPPSPSPIRIPTRFAARGARNSRRSDCSSARTSPGRGRTRCTCTARPRSSTEPCPAARSRPQCGDTTPRSPAPPAGRSRASRRGCPSVGRPRARLRRGAARPATTRATASVI